MLNLRPWTHLAECGENRCSSVKPTQHYSNLGHDKEEYTLIKTDFNVAALEIPSNITLKIITMNAIPEKPPVAQLHIQIPVFYWTCIFVITFLTAWVN